jgi:hypothetical protein
VLFNFVLSLAELMISSGAKQIFILLIFPNLMKHPFFSVHDDDAAADHDDDHDNEDAGDMLLTLGRTFVLRPFCPGASCQMFFFFFFF